MCDRLSLLVLICGCDARHGNKPEDYLILPPDRPLGESVCGSGEGEGEAFGVGELRFRHR